MRRITRSPGTSAAGAGHRHQHLGPGVGAGAVAHRPVARGPQALPVTVINNQDYIAVDDSTRRSRTTSREDRLAGGLTITARGPTRSCSPPIRTWCRWPAGWCRCRRRRCGATTAGSCRPISCRARWSPALDMRLDLRRADAAAGRRRPARPARRRARRRRQRRTSSVTFDITPNTETRVSAQPGRLIVQFDADALDLQHAAGAAADRSSPRIAPGERQHRGARDSGRATRCIASPRRRPTPVPARLTIDLLPVDDRRCAGAVAAAGAPWTRGS